MDINGENYMEIFPIPALQDNYIWALLAADKHSIVIVDPGEAAPVLKVLAQKNLKLVGILITHHHWDHTNGVPDLLNAVGPFPIVASEQSSHDFVTHRVKDGDDVVIAHVHCKALSIPGHTLDHTAYFNQQEGFLFTGDTLFSAGCGRIFEGTPEMMYASLQKLAQLGDDIKMYCGHEYTHVNLKFAQTVEPDNLAIRDKLASLPSCTLPSTVGEEKLMNPFLRCGEQSVIQSAEQNAQHELATPGDVFSTLREWKNCFF